MSTGPCFLDPAKPRKEGRERAGLGPWEGREGQGQVSLQPNRGLGVSKARAGPLTPLHPHFFVSPKGKRLRLQDFHEYKKHKNLSSSPTTPRPSSPRRMSPS